MQVAVRLWRRFAADPRHGQIATLGTLLVYGLARLGFEVDKRKIQLPEPIRALGEYSVPVRLHRDVTAQVKVLVVKAD